MPLRYAAVAFVVYFFVIWTYNILFHPLRSYPGPFLARLSNTYGAYHALLRRLHLATRQNHLRYGKVVRQGPNRLIFNSAQAFRDIYNNDRVQKSKVYQSGRIGHINSVFSAIDKDTHARKRKLVGAVLSTQSMRIFEPTMISQVDVFIDLLRDYIVSHLSFGYPLNLQIEKHNRDVADAIRKGNHRMNFYMQWPILISSQVEMILFYWSMLFKKKNYYQIMQDIIKWRSSQDRNAKHDLYSVAAEAMDAEGGVSVRNSEIWFEALFFFPAGGESVSTATSSLFFYLSRNPDCYCKLRDEIRRTFNRDGEIRSGPKLASCKYLRACIDEALRLAPPGPGAMWRERASTDDRRQPLIIDGHVIPEGTLFGVSIYTLHHNEEYFPNAFRFRPERWLSSCTSEEDMKTMQQAFVPFSMGTRGCAGKAMAYLEASMIIAKTMWHFDFSAGSGDLAKIGAGIGSADDIFTANHRGPWLNFRTRDLKEN
ncbi:cytochrome P450 [Xylariaceae sp. FL1272]|nr:cytochrome P450 [Xylariaceae sp. FL1272]